MKNVEVWIKRDLRDGKFIEAFAICDQYVDTVIKICFPEVFHETSDNRLNIENVLRIPTTLKIINGKFLTLYRDYKSTRDHLVHKSIFYPHKAQQLQNTNKIKSLPSQIIKESQQFFRVRLDHIFKYYTDNLLNRPPKDKKRWKLYSYIEQDESFRMFIILLYRIQADENKNMFKEILNDPTMASKLF